MITHIRPYKIFSLIEAPPPERVANIALPSRRGMGGVSLLEMSLIISAARIVEARRIFEFGTFLGNTTFNLALNTPKDAEILTIDLDEQCAEGVLQDPADAPLTKMHIAGQSSLAFMGSPVSHKIKKLTGDSTRYDYSAWTGSVDLAFIDGGHDLATVDSDTENAMKMAVRDKASCILWHDYRNPDYSALTYYLDDLSNKHQIYHVGDTMLCAWFNDPFNRIWPHLLEESNPAA